MNKISVHKSIFYDELWWNYIFTFDGKCYLSGCVPFKQIIIPTAVADKSYNSKASELHDWDAKILTNLN